MTAELISVGTEILMGNILNSNARYLAEKCASLGLDMYYQVTVGDNYERMMSVVKTALGRSDSVYIDVWIAPTLQRPVAPILNMDIRFLVQFTDGGGRYLAAPQNLGDVLHAPDRHPGQVHLDESLFHTALPTAVPFNDGSLKRDTLELGHLERDISRSGGEIAVIVATAVALALFIALVPGRLGQLLRLGLQQLVEGLFYATSHQFLDCFFI